MNTQRERVWRMEMLMKKETNFLANVSGEAKQEMNEHIRRKVK